MPKFTYTGEPGLHWSSLGLDNPTPGETYDLAERPNDPRWEPVKAAKVDKSSAEVVESPSK